MDTLIAKRVEAQHNSDVVEELSAYDILVGDRHWEQRGLLPIDDRDLLKFIVSRWRNRDISSTEALAWLDSQEILDPDALMIGLTSFYISRGEIPPPDVPLPPVTALLPPEWPYENMAMLEIVSKSRVA